jgi:hypothetical protein
MDLIADILLMAGSSGPRSTATCCRPAEEVHHAGNRNGRGHRRAFCPGRRHDGGAGKGAGAANGSAESLEALTARGEAVARKLELLVASLHDLPDPKAPPQRPAAEEPPEEERRLRFVRRRAARDELEAAE